MLDVLFELLIEIAGQLLFAIGGAVLSEAFSDHEQADPVLAAIGHALMGGVAGAVSLALLHRRVIDHPILPGLSLVLAPVLTGAALNLLGRWWVARGNVRMALFTFRGGFWFALAMAAVRFAYFARA